MKGLMVLMLALRWAALTHRDLGAGKCPCRVSVALKVSRIALCL